jgi:hypothetical protein
MTSHDHEKKVMQPENKETKSTTSLLTSDLVIVLPLKWLQRSDWMFLISFGLIVAGLKLVTIKYDFDEMHTTHFFMSSLHILNGKVPFRDFYPWYGPLFYYHVAGWVWLLGKSLLATKIYLLVINSWLCIAVLLFVVRAFGFTWPARLFVALNTAILGVDRLFGGTRTFLGLLLLGLWTAGTRRAGVLGRLTRALVFPSALFAYFFSPDIGMAMAGAAVLFLVMDLWKAPAGTRKRAALFYAAGMLMAGAAAGIMFQGSAVVRNFWEMSNYLSLTFRSKYGIPLPEPDEVFTYPHILLFYSFPIILAAAAGWMGAKVLGRKVSDLPLWLPALTLFAFMLLPSTLALCDLYHILFAAPPFILLAAYMWIRPERWLWPLFGLFLLFTFSIYTSDHYTFFYYHNEFRNRHEMSNADLPLEGIYVPKERFEAFARSQDFARKHPQDEIIYPLHSFEAHVAGRPALLTFDTYFSAGCPLIRQKLMQSLEDTKAPYVVMYPDDLLYLYSFEDTDPLMDYLAANYELIEESSLLIYQRRPAPVEFAELVKESRGPFVLGPEDRYTFEWELPPEFSHGYIEFSARLYYWPELLSSFSLPVIELFDEEGKKIKPKRLSSRNVDGHRRILSFEGVGKARLFLPPGLTRVKLRITFPGMANPKPGQVEIFDLKAFQFNFSPRVPFTPGFLERGY